MKELSPSQVLTRLSQAVPESLRQKVVVVGSLAAAYHFSKDDDERAVRTKDIDCLLRPHDEASVTGAQVARQLLSLFWEHRSDGDWGEGRPSAVPKDKLSVLRLYPPDSHDYFVELLGVPEPGLSKAKDFIPVEVHDGEFYCLATFRFLSLTAYEPLQTEYGIYYARPSMMALANLLSHPKIDAALMSSKYGGRWIKRSNKDLGRVLSLAYLAGDEETNRWAVEWQDALEVCFADEWKALATLAGAGFAELLASPSDLEQAYYTCVYGLLSGRGVTITQFRVIGERLVDDAIDVLATTGRTTR